MAQVAESATPQFMCATLKGGLLIDTWVSVYYVQNFAPYLSIGGSVTFSASDVIPLSQARANFSELAEDVRAGAEKLITKNGEAYIAIIDAKRLDYYHRLERERIHLLLIDEVSKGLDDVTAGRTQDARAALTAIKKRRATA